MVNDEAVRDFLVESHEGIDQLDREFVALEANPDDRERIASIFRTIHTIKGACGFLGYVNLEALTHAGESLLVLLRDGTLRLTPAMTTALLALADKIRITLKCIEATGSESAEIHEDLLQTLAALKSGESEDIAQNVTAGIRAGRDAQAAPQEATPPSPAALASSPSPSAAAQESTAGPAVSDSNVRVDVGLLDTLMNLVGELVLARNQIVQFGPAVSDGEFAGATQRLNSITTELQEQIMRTRMQPIGNVWSRLPRVVRDLSVICGKQVRVEMIGKTTELDRTIIEAIKDPLTHIVRNAVDHGIEAPDVRAAAGKPRTGTLTLKAYHEGGLVIIEISDDGAGLNVERVRLKALERGLLTGERLAQMSDHELGQLVFMPGFSTAEQVTNVSGRGVGMDVVRTHIERIGGTVDLHSRAGLGTTLKIRIPLTLAIVPALVVASGGSRFAIPQTNLLELVRLEGDDAANGIENVHGAPVYRLRGKLLPLAWLSDVLHGKDSVRANRTQSVNIVVLQADETSIGLVVDEVRDTEEIVVKPLGKELKSIPLFAGATIMGDGRVALILDVIGLAQHVGSGSRSTDVAAAASADAARQDRSGQSGRQALLLFRVGSERTMAVPLDLVARIEEFPRDKLERAGTSSVIQYRGEVLPLVDLAQVMDSGGEHAETLQVIVYTEGSRSVGFIVGRILDVVEEATQVASCTSQAGVVGAIVVQGKVADLLDVPHVIRDNAPWFFEGVAA